MKRRMCAPGAHHKTVHHVPKCMSCYKAIVVINGRAHCFHDCIYITPILLLQDLSTLCVSRITYDHLVFSFDNVTNVNHVFLLDLASISNKLSISCYENSNSIDFFIG